MRYCDSCGKPAVQKTTLLRKDADLRVTTEVHFCSDDCLVALVHLFYKRPDLERAARQVA